MMYTNLLDLNNDILNIIGDYVEKIIYELNKEEQILNEKKKFPCLRWYHQFILFDENGNCIKDKIKKLK
jgi:hypothetical protein